MAKKLDPRLLDILQKYDERPEDALWDCHGTWVVYHAAVERIAAKASVEFDPPMIVEASAANKTVALCVTGKMGDRREWSFGEASPGNCKNAYPYAMAEKRGKDRVTLKLVGLHGLAYSEEESDSFKPEPAANDAPKLRDNLKIYKPSGRTSAKSLKEDKSPDNWDAFEVELGEVQTDAALTKLALAWSHISERDIWPTKWHTRAKEMINERKEMLINAPLPDDDDTFPGDRPSRERSVLEAG